ncbi:MAG: phosphoenolpyruvate--protein phosphotransferase [Gemmatimonadales bacterium]
MIRLTADDVRLGVRARDKTDAIRAAGALLVERGYIDPGYVASMLGREAQSNTFLGRGVAIPHGLGKDRSLIRQTGVTVLQLADEVDWGPDQPVRLVVGIAARAEEHIGVLAALTDALEDRALSARLARTTRVEEVVDALTRPRTPSGGAVASDLAPGPGGGTLRREVRIRNSAGFHARPATMFAELAAGFDAEITVQSAGRTANGKALSSLLTLGAGGGASLSILATGPDAAAALAALTSAVESGLGDAVEAAPPATTPTWVPPPGIHAVTGIPAAPGVAIGPLFQFRSARVVAMDRRQTDPEGARRALAQAIEAAREQLADIHDAVAGRSGLAAAAIFHAHQALLRDADLAAEVGALIDAGHCAAWAWDRAVSARVAKLRAVADARVAARAADLHDVGQRVLRLLAGTEHGAPALPEVPVILVAEDLAPSDTARLDPRRILGLCTVMGGPTAHTAIIARSLGIAAVVGAGPQVLEYPEGAIAVLDGAAGRLYLDPGADALESARSFQADCRRRRERDFETRFRPATLTDGHRIGISANIASVAEAAQAVEAGAEGVGLMRTEFLFLDRDEAPSEDEQYRAYAAMVGALDGLPLILRTLDIGGDKAAPWLALPKEENPFLGIRGLRLCLRQPALFLPQLRAIYRASALGPVRIMLPMVSSVEEVRAARKIAERARREVAAAPVEIGIMIEVPSAALMAPELAREADFFSIGTNDLTQYVLAMDRTHPTLAPHADGLHPAVLRAVELAVRGAVAAGRWVGVCGGIAGDPVGALILTGLGVDELSMSLPSVAAVKAAMRRYSLGQAQAFARQALACATADEVRALPPP